MAVRIRMKRLGRRHRPFYRICAIDARSPRDGRVIEELGYYDPMIPETDARAILRAERIDYWLGVGAQPSDRVSVLIKKYGSNGTHRDAQQAALQRIEATKPTPPPATKVELPSEERADAESPAAEPATAEPATAEQATETEKPAS